ncbi:MAG: ABC transporter ATP-binding protein [Clostridia bacterium]|nr:ABC transporter ATP-binding protein [Clostridia bacterium]
MEIALKGVTKKYGDRVVFDRIDLTFKSGKINCVLGPSGSGKSTILNILGGLTDFEGTVEKPQKVAYIFQESRLLPNLSVWENVEYVVLDLSKEARKALIERLLKLTEIYDRRNDRPAALSGGMARRAAMARAYAYPAELLLMDEPFSALDLGLKLRQMEVYNSLAKEYPRTSVFVTHDIDEALLFSDTVTVLAKDGRIADSFDIDAEREGRNLLDPGLTPLKARLYELLK